MYFVPKSDRPTIGGAKLISQVNIRKDHAGKWSFALIMVLSLFLISFSTNALRAEVASVEEMDLVCQNWLNIHVYQNGSWAGSANPQIVDVQDLVYNDTVLAKVYSIEPRGYVVIPVLKELAPVKSYSEDCNINVNDTQGLIQLIREVLRDRVREYVMMFGSMEAEPADKSNNRFSAAWNEYLVQEDEFMLSLGKGGKSPLGEGDRLLGNNWWHQNYPYNMYCPADGGCTHTVVGCVATAMSQIMHYWEWPPEGTQEHCYPWYGADSQQVLCADFSDPYDWDNMPLTCDGGCNSVERAALAELAYECGVASNMDYGCDGSGAIVSEFPWTTYFRYDPGMYYQQKGGMSDYTWFMELKEDLDSLRPIPYFVYSHALVCDGWRSDGGVNRIHLNYGWGSWSLGWYALDSIYYPGATGGDAAFRRVQPVQDADGDGWLNDEDNCPLIYNPGQDDFDQDSVGDVCDICPNDYDPDQSDIDEDGLGDACDPDIDDDGILNEDDNCDFAINPGQQNSDSDTLGDACDNCPNDDNNDQADANGDGIGDVCDGEVHFAGDEPPNGYLSFNYYYQCEGVGGEQPYYWTLLPQAQIPYGCSFTGDTIGEITGVPTYASTFIFKVQLMDSSDPPKYDTGIYSITILMPDSVCWDSDADGYGDPGSHNPPNDCPEDNCPDVYNPNQADTDNDGLGDFCDPCPNDSLNDNDEDGWCESDDNCPFVYNPEQLDDDLDSIGNLCDNCPNDSNPDQANVDNDEYGDLCDPCPVDSLNDHDEDGWCESEDNCPNHYNPGQEDADSNGIGDACDFMCGDANGDETVNVADAVWIINFIFAGGDPPDPMESGNANCQGTVNVADSVWIINYVFAGGNEPCDIDGDGEPDC